MTAGGARSRRPRRRNSARSGKTVQADYAAALAAGASVESEEVLAITQRHHDWLVAGWQGRRPTAEQLVGMGDVYIADGRFGANYGGVEGATFVRDAMAAFAERNL